MRNVEKRIRSEEVCKMQVHSKSMQMHGKCIDSVNTEKIRSVAFDLIVKIIAECPGVAG